MNNNITTTGVPVNRILEDCEIRTSYPVVSSVPGNEGGRDRRHTLDFITG